MTTLISLPDEVKDKILSFDDISLEDIINLRCVCKRFRNVAKTTDYCFQKKKFFQRWPSAKKYYKELHKENEQQNSEKDEQKDKKCVNFIETGFNCVRQVRKYLAQMMFILKCNNVDLRKSCELRLYEDLDKITNYERDPRRIMEFDRDLRKEMETENSTQLLFCMDEIEHLLAQPLLYKIRTDYDLLEGYCYIKQFDYLEKYWRQFILRRYIKEKSHHKELLEECAAILAQQLRPGKDVPYWSVKLSLNMIALETLNFLREKHPNHFTYNKCFSHWENSNIDDNFWTEEEGIHIMDGLEEYMFDKLKFRSIESSDLEYMCIDYVLENKHGNMIILYIIFESVARRLGLRCDIITTFSDPSEIYLFWMPKYTSTAGNTDYSSILMSKEYKHIRCFNIKFDIFPDCINQIKYLWQPFHQIKFAKMLKLFLQNQSYEQYDLFFDDILTIYQHIKAYVPKTRPKETKFAVGMIVKHGNKSTNCPTGVIIGWYQTNFNNKGIIQNISNNVVPLKCSYINATVNQRTYYLILTKSDKLCHVEEDALSLTKPSWIENKNIYRYFHMFRGTHYTPNKMLATIYPHDAAVTARTIFKN